MATPNQIIIITFLISTHSATIDYQLSTHNIQAHIYTTLPHCSAGIIRHIDTSPFPEKPSAGHHVPPPTVNSASFST